MPLAPRTPRHVWRGARISEPKCGIGRLLYRFPPLSAHGQVKKGWRLYNSPLEHARPDTSGGYMLVRRALLALALFALSPGIVFAQASIAGVIRDTSGA